MRTVMHLSLDPPFRFRWGSDRVWGASFLIRAWVGCRSVRVFHFGSLVAPLGLGGQVAEAGGPSAAVNIACHGCSQGHRSGRWRRSRRAERAMRAGTAMSWARIVAVVARAWNLEARVPAARVRLNEIAASTSHAALAFICPEGRWASGPFFNSAMTFSTIAWSRWVASAASIDSPESVKTAWWRQVENKAPCPAGTVLGFRRLTRRTIRRAPMCSDFLREVNAVKGGLGDLGVGDPALFFLAVDRVRVLDAHPGVVGDLGDRPGHGGIHPGGDGEPGPTGARGGDHVVVVVRRVGANSDLSGRAGLGRGGQGVGDQAGRALGAVRRAPP